MHHEAVERSVPGLPPNRLRLGAQSACHGAVREQRPRRRFRSFALHPPRDALREPSCAARGVDGRRGNTASFPSLSSSASFSCPPLHGWARGRAPWAPDSHGSRCSQRAGEDARDAPRAAHMAHFSSCSEERLSLVAPRGGVVRLPERSPHRLSPTLRGGGCVLGRLCARLRCLGLCRYRSRRLARPRRHAVPWSRGSPCH